MDDLMVTRGPGNWSCVYIPGDPVSNMQTVFKVLENGHADSAKVTMGEVDKNTHTIIFIRDFKI